MYSTDFEEANHTFGKPKSMTDEQCHSVRAFVGDNGHGHKCVVTAWKPNADDIKALQEGRPLYLMILGEGMPPVSLYTYDEIGLPNWEQ